MFVVLFLGNDNPDDSHSPWSAQRMQTTSSHVRVQTADLLIVCPVVLIWTHYQ